MHYVPGPSLLLLLILPMQNNKSVKTLFIRDVQKDTVLSVGSHVHLMLYLPLNPTPPTYCIFCTLLITVL